MKFTNILIIAGAIAFVLLMLIIIFKSNNVKHFLSKVKVFNRLKHRGIVLNNLSFTDSSKTHITIDHVLVCEKGIYVIDAIQHGGKFKGKAEESDWTHTIKKISYKIYNPVQQNIPKVNYLKTLLGTTFVNNIVIFVNAHANITGVSDGHVTKINKFKKFLKKADNVIKFEDLKKYADILIDNTQDWQELPNKQLKGRKERALKNKVCYKCGEALKVVEKKNKTIYKCSKFPKCWNRISIRKKE